MLSKLFDMNEQWNEAWFKKDAETVERLMADDYIYVAPNGMVLDRLAVLEIIRSPGYRIDYGSHTDVVVRAIGPEAAVVRRRWQGAGSLNGVTFTDDHRCVMVCEKRAGEWRIVMEQCSYNNKP
jgi:ketosteroid isomerase-like protein